MTQLYQTVANRENADELERQGPILCVDNPWLGRGYYFWEGFIENAHWWGEVHYAGQYLICSEETDREEDMFDLVGNTNHIKEMQEVVRKLRERNKVGVTVARTLEFLRHNVKSFNFKAVRANAIGSKSYIYNNEQILSFVGSKAYMELLPPIQICVFDKSFLKGKYRVIYPLEYSNSFTI